MYNEIRIGMERLESEAKQLQSRYQFIKEDVKIHDVAYMIGSAVDQAAHSSLSTVCKA